MAIVRLAFRWQVNPEDVRNNVEASNTIGTTPNASVALSYIKAGIIVVVVWTEIQSYDFLSSVAQKMFGTT